LNGKGSAAIKKLNLKKINNNKNRKIFIYLK